MLGAQYLHEAIPGIEPGRAIRISYQLRGSIDGYREKVYGLSYHGNVSPGSLPPGHIAYDIRTAYDQLWMMYQDRIEFKGIDHRWLQSGARRFDRIFSTMPATSLCYDSRHEFRAQWVWAGTDPAIIVPEGTVLCNGQKEPGWYRVSRIFGYSTAEWPDSFDRPEDASPEARLARIRKPLYTNCNCWPDIIRLGRYGQWQKGILVHHTYAEVLKCLEGQS